MSWRQTLVGIAVALLVAWGLLVVFLVLARPRGSLVREALRLLPDTLRLFRRLAADNGLPRGIRVRLALLSLYLAMPVDIIPDFIPVIGYADDVIIACWVLRSIVRGAGAEAVRRNWPGTQYGLSALWRIAGLPGSPLPGSGEAR